MPTRALVTGGAGFIGSSIARALVERGNDVRVFDNLFSGFPENVPEEAEFMKGDILDPEAIGKACQGMELVFHQAAVRSVPRSVDEPLLTNEANVTGTMNVLMAAERAGIQRVVYASSSSVYGETDESVQREDQAPNPSSPYAVSKLAGEQYCRVWTRVKGLSTVCLRYFNVFGPGQHPESKYAAVFPAFIKALHEGRPPEVHWDGEQSRDFCFVADVVRANLLAAEAPDEASGEVCNIGGGGPRSVNEVLEAVCQTIGHRVDPIHSPKRPGDIRHTHADVSKAKGLLGWAPEADWDEAVQAAVDWFVGMRA